MSKPRSEITHFPIPIMVNGDGPEMNPDKVVRTVCWVCLPFEDWPCKANIKEG